MLLFSNILRVITGLFFIAAAFMKLYPIEPFEIVVVDTGVSNWVLAPFLTRLIISSEIILGLMLITGVALRTAITATGLMLIGFTVYLLYTGLVLGKDDDCKCMGEWIQLGTWGSIGKNITLLAILYFVHRTIALQKTLKFRKWLMAVLVIVPITLVFILNPVDLDASYNRNDEKIGKKLKIELLDNTVFSKQEVNLAEGKKVVCFFSLSCHLCKYAIEKIAIL
jgi:uncharacterized membrane protein YphA (DoxX/SURF4 family)